MEAQSYRKKTHKYVHLLFRIFHIKNTYNYKQNEKLIYHSIKHNELKTKYQLLEEASRFQATNRQF